MVSKNSLSQRPIFFFLVFFSLTLVLSCSKDEDGPDQNLPMEEEDTCTGVTAMFADDIKPIIDASCAIPTCHVSGGTANGNFETYDGIKAKTDNGSLMIRVVSRANMPPSNSSGPDLTEDQRNLIKCWIEAGAENN